MKIYPIKDKDSVFTDVYLRSDLKGQGKTPHCSKHGAMLKVSVFDGNGGLWRCCVADGIICRSGCSQSPSLTNKIKNYVHRFRNTWGPIIQLYFI